MHIEIGRSLSQRLCQLSCGGAYIRRNDEVRKSCTQTVVQSEKPSHKRFYQRSSDMVMRILIFLLPMSHRERKQDVMWWGPQIRMGEIHGRGPANQMTNWGNARAHPRSGVRRPQIAPIG